MNRDYQKMKKKRQEVFNTLQALEFSYINDKRLTIRERRRLLSNILRVEDRAVRKGLLDSLSPMWVMEKERLGVK